MQIMFRYRHHTGDGERRKRKTTSVDLSFLRLRCSTHKSTGKGADHSQPTKTVHDATAVLPRTPDQMDFACRDSHYYFPTDVTHRRPQRTHGRIRHKLSSAPAADTCLRVRRPITCRSHWSWRTLTTKTPARKPAQGADPPCTRRIFSCVVKT